MTVKINVVSLMIILMTGTYSLAQNYHTRSNRAVNAYSNAKREYDYLYFSSAEKLLKEAIAADNNFYEAHMMLGELLSKLGRYSESAIHYQHAVRIDSLFYKPVYFTLANAEFKSGNYKKALVHYKAYIESGSGSEKNTALAQKAIRNCEFAVKSVAAPVPFNPVSVGESVNTTDDEYWPSITADGQTLIFTRQGKSVRTNERNYEDFYISRYDGTAWSQAVNAGRPLNTPQNEGAQTISSDGNSVYFTACDRPGGMGRCDIYFSSFNGSIWSEARNVGPPINTNYWESQPSINSNGKVIFFSSNRPGGQGGMDLWYSVLDKNGKWDSPRNLGKPVNTEGDEMSPFIHFDGKTLYFSSDGHSGMGGFDIFIARMNPDTTWSDPVNIGYPINTYNDEMGLIIDASGENAYFSTQRNDKNGKDIFQFKLYDLAKPDPVSYFKGKVSDRETGKLLVANYELVDLESGNIVTAGQTDATGNFLVCLPSGFNYGLNVNKSGYLFYSDNFMFEGVHSVMEPFIKRILLNPVRIGETLQLTNVFYEIDSWELKSESIAELEKLYMLLKENSDILVEIGGFTDSTGEVSYNQTLSERRAKSVVEYLTSRGIDPDRLTFKGYGASSPIGDNFTDEGRRLNRRTEVKVTGKSK